MKDKETGGDRPRFLFVSLIDMRKCISLREWNIPEAASYGVASGMLYTRNICVLS